ncbi:hypothetical protein WN51_07100 [Melipona quadrifasciata]|uniref:Uncharacterized protein n=1 Tax=Melipona quadrifasciata TaxID=166423 RepID=A0A0M8ZQG3_9HYME|nr:hypothetical protein WN51_07100 [Melipona quadrifasciata]
MKQKIEQPKKQTQNTETPTYKELKEISKKLNQKIENLEKRMEEIIKLHNRHQEGTSTENKEEKMDIEENEKEEKNTQPWITIPPTKKRETKSKNSQPAEKPGTSKKPPISSHQWSSLTLKISKRKFGSARDIFWSFEPDRATHSSEAILFVPSIRKTTHSSDKI